MNFPFSLSGYADLLSYADEAGYRLMPMCECDGRQSGQPAMILRHDVDLSLDYAIDMAELERGRGVRATYFILPHGEFYDPFDSAGAVKVRSIAELGHEIGLHWDSSIYGGDVERMEQGFRDDRSRLADIAGAPVVSASQHIPIDTPFFDVEALIPFEAYSPKISARYTYVSDSAMTWRDTTPWGLIDAGRDIQFLAHPIWWMAPGAGLREKLATFRDSSSKSLHDVIEDFAEYVERCLAERTEMDAALAQKWSERR